MIPFLLVAILIGGAGTSTVVVDKVAGNAIGPDSGLYPIEKIGEGIRKQITTNKGAWTLDRANERLAEFQRIPPSEKSRHMRLLTEYQVNLQEAVNEATVEGDVETLINIQESTNIHKVVLERVKEEVPDEAKPAIEKAIAVSMGASASASQNIASATPHQTERR